MAGKPDCHSRNIDCLQRPFPILKVLVNDNQNRWKCAVLFIYELTFLLPHFVQLRLSVRKGEAISSRNVL